MRKSILTSTFLLCAILAIQAQRIKIQSPDKNISVEIRAGENLSYSVNFGDKNIILPSALGFQFVNEPLLGNDVIVTDSTRKVVNEKWTPVVSKHKEITDNCNEVQLQLEERKFPQRKFTIYFRVYNDGVAFRYFLPMQHGFSNREITRELTSYRFVQNHDAWMANYGSYTTSQETEFGPGEIGDLNEKSIIGLPLLV
jgi:alpha-glucosidase